MKKALLIFIILISFNGFSQISHGGRPISFDKNLSANIPVFSAPILDITPYKNEDAITDLHKDIPWRFGIEQHVNLNLSNAGKWDTLNNGDRLWRLNLESPNALSINLNFSDFFLPNGAQFFVYNKNETLGAFTSSNNKSTREFSTRPIKGQTVTLEYFEPKEATDSGSIQINSLVHGYRDFFKQLKAFGSSGSCNVNAVCDTNLWGNEIRSSVMLLTAGNTRFCSGALISNVPKDGTPFVLTANHCGPNTNNIFMFNYQSPGCTPSTDGNTTQTVSGCILRANDTPSDFYLVELSSIPPASYNVFYSGWSNINTAPTKGTGIHHPAGDVKKISHDTDPLIESGYYMAGNDHWEVLDWNSGTTEGGSSGSPLYDQNHRIVGQLHGGDAACNNDDFDFYGKFSVSWDNNSNNNRQLKFWLDPSNTGATTVDGYDPNGSNYTTDAVLLDISGIKSFICGDSIRPKITIRNHGNNTLTSLTINYEIDNSGVNQINWSGNLPAYAIDSVILPTQFVASGNHIFEAFCSNPNSTTDQNNLNDSSTVNFISNANPIFYTLYLNTDDYGGETSWIIRDASGGVYMESPGYASVNGGEQISESLCLYDSCFTFVLKDSYGDGFCCGFGNGSVYLVDNLGDTIYQNTTFNSDSVSTSFCITTGINDYDEFNNINIFPNPNNGTFTIETELKEEYQIIVTDILGQEIYNKNSSVNIETIKLPTIDKGVYLVTLVTNQNRITKRIVIK